MQDFLVSTVVLFLCSYRTEDVTSKAGSLGFRVIVEKSLSMLPSNLNPAKGPPTQVEWYLD